MKGPDLETLEFNKSTNGDVEFSSPRDSIAKVKWNNISVDRGWNCIKVSSRNTPKQISYSSSRPDFRPLAFAIGEVRVRILNVNR
jgi:hypothetical protein